MTAPQPADVAATVVRPFHGMLVTPGWAERVVSPMLDAVTPETHAALLAQQRYSWLHVTAGPEVRALSHQPTGADALHELLDAGAFAAAEPGGYVYRITDHGGSHLGVVVDVDAEAFVNGQVRGHEAVHPERVEAVLSHFSTVPARSELVALLRAHDPVVDEVVARTTATAPLLDFAGHDTVRHTVWRVAEQDWPALGGSLGSRPLYVADGHHRVAASLRTWANAGRPPGAGLPCVLYAPDGLRLESFHRRVRGPLEPDTLAADLRERLRAVETDEPAAAVGTVAAYVGKQWYALPCHAADEQAARGVAALDVARLHLLVLRPLLGIVDAGDPRLEVRPATEPIADLVAECDADDGALFVVSPPSLDQLVDVADRGEVMVPKSTFFEPKPRAGIFLQVAPAGEEVTADDVR